MSAQCFYPDGTLSKMLPCNPNAKASACCAHGDTCLANGLCASTWYFNYRGACTAKDWPAQYCASLCVSATSGASIFNSYQIITSCDPVLQDPKQFTCNPDSSTCSKSNFTLASSPIVAFNLTAINSVQESTTTQSSSSFSSSLTTTIPTSTSTQSSRETNEAGTDAAQTPLSSSTSTALPTASKDNKNVTPAVLGVSISASILIISLISLLLWFREYRLRKAAESALRARTHAIVHPNPRTDYYREGKSDASTPLSRAGMMGGQSDTDARTVLAGARDMSDMRGARRNINRDTTTGRGEIGIGNSFEASELPNGMGISELACPEQRNHARSIKNAADIGSRWDRAPSTPW